MTQRLDQRTYEAGRAGILVPQQRVALPRGLRRIKRHAMLGVPMFVPSGMSGRNARPVAGSGGGGGGGASFTWYPALDKNSIPFHVGAGAWGIQSTIKEPVGPTTTSTGTAGNVTQLRDALGTPGTRVTMSDDIPAGSYNVTITDADLIVPPGALLGAPVFGGPSNPVTRLRVRGNTVGAYSGGQVDHFWLFGTGSDCIIDGIDLSGDEDIFAVNFGPSAGFNRGAIVNCRIASGGYAIGSTTRDLVVAGCSILTGLSWPWTTNDEGYGIRAYFETLGNVIVYDCDIRSNPARETGSHARFRCHPTPGLEYVWISHCLMVERVEHWLFWVDAAAGGGSGDALAIFFDDNECITTGTGTAVSASTPKLTGGDTGHAFVRNNIFRSNGFLSSADITVAGTSSTTKTPNTYTTVPGSDPAWKATTPGDPSSIPWDLP